MKKSFLAWVAAAALLPLAAQAQQSYVGASAGRAQQKNEFAIFSSKEDDTGYKLYGGYRFNQTFGVEAGVAWLGEADTRLSGTIVTTEPRAYYAAATASLPLSGSVALFGKLGVAHSRVKFSNFGAGGRTRSHNGALVGVGASYAFTPAIAGVLEYERFGKTVDDGGFSAKADLWSLGVRAGF
jgi:OOP family OmpA-OmpF porin